MVNKTMCTITSLILTVPVQEAFPLHKAVQRSSSHRPGLRLGLLRSNEPAQSYDMFQSRESPAPAHFPLLHAGLLTTGAAPQGYQLLLLAAVVTTNERSSDIHIRGMDSVLDSAEGQGHKGPLWQHPWHYTILWFSVLLNHSSYPNNEAKSHSMSSAPKK